MLPDMKKARVTEIKVRMDCNGCVNKIKKALHAITGIYDIYVDLSQQKITVIGWADPEIILKAIKKTRKGAIISSHSQPFHQPIEPTPEGGATRGGAPPPESTNPPAETAPPEGGGAPPSEAETTPPEEPSKEQKDQENPSNESAIATSSELTECSEPKDHEAIHVIHHHPPKYNYRSAYCYNYQHGYGGQWHDSHGGPGFRREHSQPLQPVCVTHGYNTYKPSPYVTEYAYYSAPGSPPRYLQYSSRPDHYTQDYYSGNTGNGNITSMFSEDNPNACRIV
ncbi:Heavy metal-associated isoprenylated plant protein 23 [Sesamum alatum]|uniref:Heavy metal-associated isoprenylated plant protein 23 n=1 Tax=Sesamum alatum TaxID=300844 RepID=A0AAE2CKX3_9LAMI|nr:Heavy metal-associated isoprenylated plant protein 23 [Sesamum alatum]